MSDLAGTNVGEIISSALQEFQRALLAEEAWKLRDDSNFSDHEEQILEGLGPPEEWAGRVFDWGAGGLYLAEELSGSHPEWDYYLQDALDPSGNFHSLAKVGLQVSAGLRFAKSLPTLEERAAQLVWLALEFKPSKAVAKFCRHLGRCYVAGLDGECVILCRSVLDAALKEAIGKCPKELQELDRKPRSKDLNGRIPTAIDMGLLSPESRVNADLVRIRGNKAVHGDPETTREVFETIKMTMALVEELLDPRSVGNPKRHR